MALQVYRCIYINASNGTREPDDRACFRTTEGADAATFTTAADIILQSLGADEVCSTHAARQFTEQQQVVSWVRTSGIHLFSDEELGSWRVLSDKTSEHKVYFPEPGIRVFKVTWPGFYGQIPCLNGGKLDRRSATPSEYLQRQALQNEVFASDLRLEGVNISDKPSMVIGEPSGQPCFVVSQTFYEAADETVTTPDVQQVAEFMERFGFKQVPGTYFGWFREADGVAVTDAKLDNFILTTGGVVPIDLQIAQV